MNVRLFKSTGRDRSWTGDYAACGRCHLAHAEWHRARSLLAPESGREYPARTSLVSPLHTGVVSCHARATLIGLYQTTYHQWLLTTPARKFYSLSIKCTNQSISVFCFIFIILIQHGHILSHFLHLILAQSHCQIWRTVTNFKFGSSFGMDFSAYFESVCSTLTLPTGEISSHFFKKIMNETRFRRVTNPFVISTAKAWKWGLISTHNTLSLINCS